MKNRFDLEADIMEAWHTVDDIDLIYHATDEMTLNAKDCDNLQNQLLGLKHLTELRFKKLWESFEASIKDSTFHDGAL